MLSRSWGDRQAADLTGGACDDQSSIGQLGPLWKPQALGAPLAGPLKRSVGWRCKFVRRAGPRRSSKTAGMIKGCEISRRSYSARVAYRCIGMSQRCQ